MVHLSLSLTVHFSTILSHDTGQITLKRLRGPWGAASKGREGASLSTHELDLKNKKRNKRWGLA